MNRRGFFAALASLPFVPKALAAAPARKASLELANLARAKAILGGFPDQRARYAAAACKAINRQIDRIILAEFEKR